jgi:hypothetical protein
LSSDLPIVHPYDRDEIGINSKVLVVGVFTRVRYFKKMEERAVWLT